MRKLDSREAAGRLTKLSLRFLLATTGVALEGMALGIAPSVTLAFDELGRDSLLDLTRPTISFATEDKGLGCGLPVFSRGFGANFAAGFSTGGLEAFTGIFLGSFADFLATALPTNVDVLAFFAAGTFLLGISLFLSNML